MMAGVKVVQPVSALSYGEVVDFERYRRAKLDRELARWGISCLFICEPPGFECDDEEEGTCSEHGYDGSPTR